MAFVDSTSTDDETGTTSQPQEEDEGLQEKIINEEYKTWKKNAPFLYDLVLSTALDWPSLTAQWFPDKQSNPDNNFSQHRLLIGTHTTNDAPNYLQIAHVQLPNSARPDVRDYDEERGEIGGYGASGAGGKEAAPVKFEVVQKIDHPGEVNKARYMPQNPNLIASLCVDGRVLIWDRTKHSLEPDGTPKPQIELRGHRREGYGLGWSSHSKGHLVTGNEDNTVKLWDITQYSKTDKVLPTSRTFTHHESSVNDVQYHPFHPSLVGSVSDDCSLHILDLREGSPANFALRVEAHDEAINALAFSPASEFVLATGSADKTIGLFDLRNIDKKLHALEAHNESVTGLSWHPFEEAVLASSSYDRRIIFWDLSKIGTEQPPDDIEDGPPELMFMHGGHTNRISDFTWNPNLPWVVASTAEDNLVQIWQVSNSIVGKEIDDVEMEELEAIDGDAEDGDGDGDGEGDAEKPARLARARGRARADQEKQASEGRKSAETREDEDEDVQMGEADETEEKSTNRATNGDTKADRAAEAKQ